MRLKAISGAASGLVASSVSRDRKLFEKIDLAVDDLLHRRRFYLLPRQGIERGMLEMRQHA
jgi:hypothetical protein